MKIANESLDGYRGVLALIVCFAHSWQILINPQYGPLGWDHAVLGMSARWAVVAFYVLSGWVIAQSVFLNIERNKKFNHRDWVLNRVARILPPLLVSILICFLIWIVVRLAGVDQVDTPHGLARYKFTYKLHLVLAGIATFGFFGDLTGAMNGPLWSLGIEIQLYFIVFLIFFLRQTSLWVAIFILMFASYRVTTDSNLLLGYASFAMGFAGFHLSRTTLAEKNTALFFFRIAGWTVLMFVVTSMLYFYSVDHRYLDALTSWNSIYLQVFFAFGFSLILLGACNFRLKPMIIASSFSYTLYIIHFPVLLLISYFIYRYTSFMSSPFLAWVLWFVGALVSIAVAYWVGVRVERAKSQKFWIINKFSRLAF